MIDVIAYTAIPRRNAFISSKVKDFKSLYFELSEVMHTLLEEDMAKVPAPLENRYNSGER